MMIMFCERIMNEMKTYSLVKPNDRPEDKRWKYPIACGELTRESKSDFETWATRYFILTARGILWCFRNSHDLQFPVEEPVKVKGGKYLQENRKRKYVIRIESRDRRDLCVIAENKSDFEFWMTKLFEAGCVLMYDFFGSNLKLSTSYNFPYGLLGLMDHIKVKVEKKSIKYPFMKAGCKEKVEKIKKRMITATVNYKYFRIQDCYDLCDVLKYFCRSVPEAFFSHIYDDLLLASNQKKEVFQLIQKNVMNKYPLLFGLSREVLALLHDISVKMTKKTKLTPLKLAQLFAPMFLRPESLEEIPLHQLDEVNDLMVNFIENYQDFFGKLYTEDEKRKKTEQEEIEIPKEDKSKKKKMKNLHDYSKKEQKNKQDVKYLIERIPELIHKVDFLENKFTKVESQNSFFVEKIKKLEAENSHMRKEYSKVWNELTSIKKSYEHHMGAFHGRKI